MVWNPFMCRPLAMTNETCIFYKKNGFTPAFVWNFLFLFLIKFQVKQNHYKIECKWLYEENKALSLSQIYKIIGPK